MTPYHRVYRIAIVLLLAAVSGCGGNQVPDSSAAAATRDDQAKTELEKGDDFYDREDYDAAIACYNQAIRLNPNDVSAYKHRGRAYSKKGEYDKAIEDYTKIIRLKPNDVSAYFWRGGAHKQKGDTRKARADFDKAKALR